jgi:hypothetical protein
LVAVPVFTSSDYFLQRQPELISRHYAGESPFPESAELGQYLALHTAPEDRIFIFGSEPEILVLANRKSATPFIMIYPLTREYPRYLEFQDRVLNDVVNNTPAYILVVNIPASVLWDGHADLGIQRHLEELIRNHYRLEAVMPVEWPKGKLVVLSQGESAPAGVDVGIFLYHRIAN